MIVSFGYFMKEIDYLHYKKVGFNTIYKFFEDGTYQDTFSPKSFGKGTWDVKII